MSLNLQSSKLIQDVSLMTYGSKKHVSLHGCMKGK